MFAAVLTFLILGSALSSSAGAAALIRDLTVFCPPAPPGASIDGALTEIFWQVPPAFDRFVNLSGRTPQEPTAAWAAYGKEGLYFGFECTQRQMSPTNTPGRKEVWLDDSVEVFIDVNGDRRTYEHFIVSAVGGRLHERTDASGAKRTVEKSDWKSATSVGDGRWTAEIFIPYSILGVTVKEGDVLRVNLARNNAALGESSCWSPSGHDFHQPLAFGNLVAGVPPAGIKLSANAGEAMTSGASSIRVWCSNQTASDVKLTATLFPGAQQLKSSVPLEMPAGRQLTANVEADLRVGLINLRLTATDSKTGARKAEASFTGTVAPRPPSAPGAVISSGRWGTLWSCLPTFKVMRQTAPPGERAQNVRIYAARNEFEPFQLVLRPSSRVRNVRVTPRSLTGPRGARIEAWNVSVRNVEYVHVTEPTGPITVRGMYPDPLPEFQPFTAEPGVNSPVWITVYVPPTATPGEYSGTVDITGEGMDRLTVPIRLRVWNFTLPTVASLRTAYGFDLHKAALYHGAKTLEQKRRLTELYNRDAWRHRIAPFAPYQFYELNTSLEGGRVKVDFSDFDIAVSKYFPLFNSFMLPHFGMYATAGLDMGGDYPRLKVEYMRTVAEYLINRGQLQKGYNYIFDEPTTEQFASILEEAKLSRMADSRIKVLLTLLTEPVEPELVGFVDIWCPIISKYDERRAKERQALGEQVWWYVCTGPRHPYPNMFIDYPAVDHRVYHWITWRYGVDGILYWQTMYWRDNPYETPMSYTPDGKGTWGNGDGNLLYPPVRKPSDRFVDRGPVPSLRWEIIREGMEDYEYFHMLRSLLQKAKSQGKKTAAVSSGEEALKLVDSCVQSPTSFCTDPARLERIRVRVAEAIEALNR